jgi:RNA polymerase sigma-70 factor (ECF subfamily)
MIRETPRLGAAALTNSGGSIPDRPTTNEHDKSIGNAVGEPDEDAELIEASRQGAVHGFRGLYEKYSSRIYVFARRFLADEQHAEDVTQEVFLQVFRKLDGFRGDSKFSTWLFRVTVNSCKNKRRSLERERRLDPVTFVERARAVFGSQPPRTLAGSPEPPPERELGQRELREEIERALAALTDEQRTMVLLKSVRELSYKEIGDVLSQSEAQVRGKLYRARKVFRDALACGRRSGSGRTECELEAEVLAELGE